MSQYMFKHRGASSAALVLSLVAMGLLLLSPRPCLGGGTGPAPAVTVAADAASGGPTAGSTTNTDDAPRLLSCLVSVRVSPPQLSEGPSNVGGSDCLHSPPSAPSDFRLDTSRALYGAGSSPGSVLSPRLRSGVRQI